MTHYQLKLRPPRALIQQRPAGLPLPPRFTEIPEGTTSLDLRCNYLNYKTSDALEILANRIPKSVTSLCLAYNQLTITQLTTILDLVSNHVTSLDLSGSFLHIANSDKLTLFIQNLPENLISLKLRSTGLSGIQLHNVLRHLPRHVTSLDLSANGLNDNPEMICLKSGAPFNVSEKHNRTYTALIKALNQIPEHVTSLTLSHSDLDQMSVSQLCAMLDAIPPHVVSINLRDNQLFKNKTHEEIDAFLMDLGDRRTRLDLSHNDEPEFFRTIGPLIQMTTSGIPTSSNVENLFIPVEVTTKIASFFSNASDNKMFTNIDAGVKQVEQRKEQTQKQKNHQDERITEVIPTPDDSSSSTNNLVHTGQSNNIEPTDENNNNNYSFMFQCIAALGGSLILIGLLILSPVMVITGACILGVSVLAAPEQTFSFAP